MKNETIKLTMRYKEVSMEGTNETFFIGTILEFDSVIANGNTLQELKENLLDELNIKFENLQNKNKLNLNSPTSLKTLDLTFNLDDN